jgi:hypothetical protein
MLQKHSIDRLADDFVAGLTHVLLDGLKVDHLDRILGG